MAHEAQVLCVMRYALCFMHHSSQIISKHNHPLLPSP